MLRSLYSAVSGMKSHQTKMDVIGNNIANVNTFGFKSSRTSFQDVFYQTISNATGGSATRGGTNATQVGFGAQVGGIDLNMNRSPFQATDRGMDLAIAGEGFFQVQDPDGNIYYTRAGALNIDNSGNLTDSNGNIVLGVSGNPLGKAGGSEKLQLYVPPVQPTRADTTENINEISFMISSEKTTVDANVAINFLLDPQLPDGSDVVVEAGDLTNASITVRVNEAAVFSSLDEFTEKMNRAIAQANKGEVHPAGNFNIMAVPSDSLFPANGLTGAEIIGQNFTVKEGSVSLAPSLKSSGIFGGMLPKSVSSNPMFDCNGGVTFSAEYKAGDEDAGILAEWHISAKTADGRTFTGTVNSKSTSAKSVLLKEVDANGVESTGQYIEMAHRGFNAISSAWKNEHKGEDLLDGAKFNGVPDGTAAPSTVSRDIGLGSRTFKLTKGTSGGPQTTKDCTSVSILANGVIEAIHANLGRLQLGRIDLVNFENPSGLEEVGNSYFAESNNSGRAVKTPPGVGGTGGIQSAALEMSNVDISSEFSDMIVTQRGFQANSRIITVSDEILNELVNLKR